MQYNKNYYQKGDFDKQDDTDYTVDNDINQHIIPTAYESDYTLGSSKKHAKRFPKDDDTMIVIPSPDDIDMPSNDSEGIAKSIVAFCFALISVAVLLFIANIYYALEPTLGRLPLFFDKTTDFAARTLGTQTYVYIGFASVFLIISSVLSAFSIKTFVTGGQFGNSKPIVTFVFGLLSAVLCIFALVLIILLFVGSPILL